jgi:ABC-type lipoprotein export system ATPase subunit
MTHESPLAEQGLPDPPPVGGPVRLRWRRLRRIVATRHYGGPSAVSRIEIGIPDGELRAGSLVICTGPTGSGKTTLLSALALADLEFEGTVEIASDPGGTAFDAIEGGNTGERLVMHARRRLGLVFQDDRLIEDRTALDNVMLSLEARGLGTGRQRREASVAALRQVGLPDRDHTRRVSEFSGGMKRRTSLARAIAGHPVVLLCDEPSQGLDGRNARAIWKLLDDLAAGGMAVLAVTHDPAGREFADGELRLAQAAVGEAPPELPERAVMPPALPRTSLAARIADVFRGAWALLWPRARLASRLLHLASVLLPPTLAALLLVLSLGLTRALRDFIADVEQRFPSPRRLAITSTGGIDAERHLPSLESLRAVPGVADVRPRWFYSAVLLDGDAVDNWDESKKPPDDAELDTNPIFEIGHVDPSSGPDTDGQWAEWGDQVRRFSAEDAPEALVEESALDRLGRGTDIAGQDLYFAVRQARASAAPARCVRLHVIGTIPAREEPEVRPLGEVVVPTRLMAALIDFGMNRQPTLPSGVDCFAEALPSHVTGLPGRPSDRPDYIHVYAHKVDDVDRVAGAIRNLEKGEDRIPFLVESNDAALVRAQAFLRWGSWAAWLVGAVPCFLAAIAMFVLTSFLIFARRSIVLLGIVQGASASAEAARVVVFAVIAALGGGSAGVALGVSFGRALTARTQEMGWSLLKVPQLFSATSAEVVGGLALGSALAALLGAWIAESGNPATVFRGGG